MSNPTEKARVSTPTLEGSDAERLLTCLKDVCSPLEAQRRIEMARREIDELMRPKHVGGEHEPR